ncbi:hypothetical protein GF314_16325 [bacterium]|nr:hypothetical protein [bacterium]
MTRVLVTLILALPVAAMAAGPAFWDSPQDVPFTDGDLDGAGLDARGALVPGFTAEGVLADSSLVFWTAIVDGRGRTWLGSGHDGRVWRLDDDDEVDLVAHLETEEVFALAPREDGVLAGCGPGGQLVQIDDDGGLATVATVPGGYVWDLAAGDDGDVYVAAGNPAMIHRLTADGELETLAALPCNNALDVAVLEDGTLLVAAQGPGRVFHVRPDQGDWALVLALEQDEVRQVVQGPDGWYALGYQTESGGNGSGGNGRGFGSDQDGSNGPLDIMVTASADVKQVRSVLYRLGDPSPVRVWSSEHVIASVAWSVDHGWLAAGAREDGGPSELFALDWPNVRRPIAAWDGGDVVELVLLPDDDRPDRLLATQANPGRVTRLGATPDGEARAVSAPLDGRHTLRWARLTWQGNVGGDQPRFAVRVGMSRRPDATWSDWYDLGRGRDLVLDDVPPSRALQWRVTVPSGSRVTGVTVSAVEPNLAPAIARFGIEAAGPMLMGGLVPGQDNITQQLPSGLKVEYNLGSRPDDRAPRERTDALRPLRTFTFHGIDPNEDRLTYRLSYRALGESTWRPLNGPTRDQVYTWDTSRLADGDYEVRLMVDDGLDNPPDRRLSAVRTLGPVRVDNTAPELSDWTLAHRHDGFTIELEAHDRFGPLAGAALVLPDGTRRRLDPVDGVCDSAEERFAREVTFPALGEAAPPRPWSVRVQVWDLQGNVAETTGVLP